MSNQWMQPDDDEFDDDGGQAQTQVPKGLRTQLNKVTKENKELKEANDKLLKQVRQTVISQVLSAKGIDAKVAKLVPSDVEPTEEAIGTWLTDYADFFVPKAAGKTEAPAEKEEGESEAEGGDDAANADFAAQMGRMSDVANSAQAPGRQADLMKQITSKDLTQEQLLDLITAHGGGVGTG